MTLSRIDGGPPPAASPSVVHMLAAAADLAPGAEAIQCAGETLDYTRLASAAAALADRLRDTGLGPGDRVATVTANSVDAAIAHYAVQAAGAQVVPLNPAYTDAELAPILADAAPGAVLHDAAHGTRLGDFAGTVPCIPAEGLAGAGGGGLEARHMPDPDAPATLLYTGGTTGRPKGVSLIHRAVAVNIAQREALLPTGPDERILALTPLFHVYAVSMGLHLAAACRGTLHLGAKFDAGGALATIEREAITFLAASPTILLALMAHPRFGAADLTSLRVCASGSAPLPAATLAAWEAATGCPVCEGYGQTEAGPVLTYNPLRGARRACSVGVPVPGTVIEIVDAATGAGPLPRGADGEIRARGPQVMSGYRGRPEETAAALRDGWLHTGDIGRIEADGTLTIADRLKDMVVSAGYNVYPREVEEALAALPGVAEVAVIGVPDDYRGEALLAFAVPASGSAPEPDALLAALGTRLAKYKWPREIRLLAALPRTAIGKIDKTALRAAARERRPPPPQEG